MSSGLLIALLLATCPVTTPATQPFSPPAPYPATAPAGSFWYGTERLWTLLPLDATWQRLPHTPRGFHQKVFWWHTGFDGRIEPAPQFTVTGRRLDGLESFTRLPPATNASNRDFGGWTILTGIDVPSTGCWELTGSYRGHIVKFIIWIRI